MNRPPFEVADIIRAAWQQLHREQPVLADVAAPPRAVRHRALPYGNARRPPGPVLAIAATRPSRSIPAAPALPEVPNQRARQVARRAQQRTAAGQATFTLSSRMPHELSWLALQNKKIVYDLLFRASAATLLEVAADPKHLGAEIGF